MKWIIYFCCYISSSGTNHQESPIVGRIVITKDSVETYLYPHQYIKWRIETAEVNYSDKKEIVNGIYHLSRPYGRSVLRIGRDRVMQMVVFDNDTIVYRDHIKVKRKKFIK